ncbi:MAG: DUF4124 domain-containing protein [Deltaproteobacteria bacterium]|nr:DUF4124 domain-containing protein [Deltaproteobacteria bacterium]
MRPFWLVAVAVLVATQALAGDLYKWTDANGVVHYADFPPPNAKGVSTAELPPASRIGFAPTIAPTAEPNAANATPAPEGTPNGTPGGTPGAAGEPGSGPARVVLTTRDAQMLGEGRMEIRGKVKNEGGAPAEAVAVAVRVVEPTQGEECLSGEIAVEPARLGPGESGEFVADFDDPCLRGPTNTDLQVVWD